MGPRTASENVMQPRFIIDITSRQTAGDVRQPLPHGITETTAEGEQVSGIKSLLNAFIASDAAGRESPGIFRVPQPEIAAVSLDTENPASPLKIITKETTEFGPASVQVVGRMVFDASFVDRNE